MEETDNSAKEKTGSDDVEEHKEDEHAENRAP